MKKSILTAAGISLLFLAACTKSSSSSSPASSTSSTFSITFNGKTYHSTATTSVPPVSVTATPTSGFSGGYYGNDQSGITSGGYSIGITVMDSHQATVSFTGEKLDASTAVGTYRTGICNNVGGSGANVFYGGLILQDNGDGNKQYRNETNTSGIDTNSIITVSVANGTEIKGTFNVTLTYNGVGYPATGDFDYHK